MMPIIERLELLVRQHKKFLNKGGLCVALVVTKTANDKGLPIAPESLRTTEGGQVAGLGKAAVQNILAEHGITKVLAEEGGRTSRGSLGLMEAYVKALNDLEKMKQADLATAMKWWIGKVLLHFASEGPKFNFDPGKSVAANLTAVLNQASEIQKNSGGANFVGAMLQHLVGAKLDIVLGAGKIGHHGYSVADSPKDRNGDFDFKDVSIHVTTHPSEALIRKTAVNLGNGIKPIIVTLAEGVEGASYLLKNTEWRDRVDIIDATQFLTANVYEHSLFAAADCRVTLDKIFKRYNEIVEDCETDPVLKIRL